MRKYVLLILAVFLLMGCGGKHNNPSPALPPAQATLLYPSQNLNCTTGTVVSNTLSNIQFSWQASAYTNSYQVVVKNLLTSDSTIQNVTADMIQETLLRSTPYSWYVISKSSSSASTAKSAVWKFYNSGTITTMVPFPAAIISPTYGEIIVTATDKIDLSWTGSEAGNGVIANYDVYFGTSANPPLFKSAITYNYINNVQVTGQTTYYWQVVTRDANGNTSSSGVYEFSTD